MKKLIFGQNDIYRVYVEYCCYHTKGALEGAEPVTRRYKSKTAAVLSIVPFEQSTR